MQFHALVLMALATGAFAYQIKVTSNCDQKTIVGFYSLKSKQTETSIDCSSFSTEISKNITMSTHEKFQYIGFVKHDDRDLFRGDQKEYFIDDGFIIDKQKECMGSFVDQTVYWYPNSFSFIELCPNTSKVPEHHIIPDPFAASTPPPPSPPAPPSSASTNTFVFALFGAIAFAAFLT
jgi:hypothetical protein